MTKASRRNAIKTFGAAAAVAGLSTEAKANSAQESSTSSLTSCPWSKTHDRVWLGGEYWANPMEDWRIVDGGAEVQSGGGARNIHMITHQVTSPEKGFTSTVTIQRVEAQKQDGGAGFRIGVKSELNEHRSNVFAKNGIEAGIRDGKLFVGRKSVDVDLDPSEEQTLTLSAKGVGSKVELKLTVGGESVAAQFEADQLKGNFAVVSNFDPKINKQQGARYRFTDWTATGDGFSVDESRKFGPILWSMYSLSDSRQR